MNTATHIEVDVTIAAPPQRIWDATVDIERAPTWNPTLTSVEKLDPGPVRVGTRARLMQPGNRPAIWTVTRLEEAREYVWETRALGMTVTATHLIRPVAEGTHVTLAIDIAGPTRVLFGWLVRRVSYKFLPQEAAALKAEAER